MKSLGLENVLHALSRMWHSSGSGVSNVCSGALRSSSSSLVASGPVLALVLVRTISHMTPPGWPWLQWQ